MKVRINRLLFAAACGLAIPATPALADRDRYSTHHEWRDDRKEELHVGACKIEREWKKNGDFKEEHKCDGSRHQNAGWGYVLAEGKDEFWEGGCKIEREWKKNGDYKIERKCGGRARHGFSAGRFTDDVHDD